MIMIDFTILYAQKKKMMVVLEKQRNLWYDEAVIAVGFCRIRSAQQPDFSVGAG